MIPGRYTKTVRPIHVSQQPSMITLRPIAVVLFSLGLAFGPESVRAQDSNWTVWLQRAGAVHFGMTLEEASRVLGDSTAEVEPYVQARCEVLRSVKLPEHVSFLVIRDTVIGIDVGDTSVHTASGAATGDSEDRIKTLYGRRIQVRPHPKYPHGHYLVYIPSDARNQRFRLIFETDGAHVLWWRAGITPAIDSPDDCQ
jgi:hypothetical protein